MKFPVERPETPELIPDQYVNSRFWRFVLDTKAGAPRPDEPRFRQFAENLRNYAVTAVIFKAAGAMSGVHHPFITIGRFLLFGLAVLATFFCVAQQFALLVISSHWYIGWDTIDHMSLSDPVHLRLFKAAGMKRPALKARAKFWGSLLGALLCLWAMLAFVYSPIH